MTLTKPRAVVVLSGGQDSTTTLIRASQESEVVGAVHFQYGQKHSIETECARWWAKHYGLELTILEIPTFGQIGNSNLLKGQGDVNQSHPSLTHLPSSFVPGRNLIFLTFAASVAMKLGATEIWTGVCEADEAGYPDCRIDTLSALQTSIRRGMDFPEFKIKAPLIKIDKAETWRIAEEAGLQFAVLYLTHTCYNGDHQTLHYYGFGCGECPSCRTRREGYDEWLRRYHYSSYEALQASIKRHGNTFDNFGIEKFAPWWADVPNITEALKGLPTNATELPIKGE